MKTEEVVLQVIDLETREVVYEVRTTESRSDKVEMGMLRNMNLEKFSVQRKGEEE